MDAADTAPPASSGSVARRAIRSFVLRQGRTSPAQQRALDDLLPRFAIPFAMTPIDYRQIFGRQSPVVLEIGFGMGETIAAIAEAYPARDFIGIEVHGPGIGSLLNRVQACGLRNVRVIRHDAVDVVTSMIPPDSLSRIHVYFPDPWPKKRHHKRRLLNVSFVHALAQRLIPSGVLHAATDWEDYAQAMLGTMNSEPLLINTAVGFAARPTWRPFTRFETRASKLGYDVRELVFRRR